MDGHNNNNNRPRDPRESIYRPGPGPGGGGHQRNPNMNIKRNGSSDAAADGNNPPNAGRGYSGYHHTPHHHRGGGGGGGHHRGGGGAGRHNNNNNNLGSPGNNNNNPFEAGNNNKPRGGGGGGGGGGQHFHYGRGGKNPPQGGGGGGFRGKGGFGGPGPGGLPQHAPPVSQKEREMLSIYGRGPPPVPEPGPGPGGPFGGGDGGICSVNPNADGPFGKDGLFGKDVGPPGPGGKRKHILNPCRFAGHEHDWKDCPNNFRNKKKMKMMGGPFGKGGGGGGGGGHGNPYMGGKGRGRGGGGGGVIETGVAGHYGPAVAQSNDLPRGGGGGGPGPGPGGSLGSGGMDRRSGSIDRGMDRGGGGGGGPDRGYEIYGPKNEGHGGGNLPSLGSRSKSFGDDLRAGAGAGGGRGGDRLEGPGRNANSNPGNVFSPKPPAGGERQNRPWNSNSAFHRDQRDGQRGDRGGEGHNQQQQRGDGGTRNAPFSPAPLPGKPPVHPHQQAPGGGGPLLPKLVPDARPPAPPTPLPSPITSMKNDRGYSFTPTSAFNRGRSGGSERAVPEDDDSGVAGDDGKGEEVDDGVVLDRIMAPPLHREQSRGRAESSPGEIRDAARNEGAASAAAARAEVSGGVGKSLSFNSPHRKKKTEGAAAAADLAAKSASAPSSKKAEPSSLKDSYASLASPKPRYLQPPNSSSPPSRKATSSGETNTHSSPGEIEKSDKKASLVEGVTRQSVQQPKKQKPKKPTSTNDPASSTKGGGSEAAGSESSTTASAPQQPKIPAKLPTPHPKKADKEAKKQRRRSLACASLGDVEKIRKAEDIVARMAELADHALAKAEGGSAPLPTKMQITKCMAVLEMKIKAKGKEAMSKRKEVKAMEAKEEEERERKRVEEAREEERQAREEEERMSKLAEETEARRKEIEESLEKKKQEFDEAYEARRVTLREEREVAVARMKEECRSEAHRRVRMVNDQISVVCAQLQGAEREIQQIDERAALRREAELTRAKVAAEAAPEMIPEDTAEEEEEDGSVPTLDFPGKMSGLVATVLAENQRRAKRSHLEALECIPYFSDAGAEGGEEGAAEGAATAGGGSNNDERRPKNDRDAISNKEWSNRARNVTGLHDALYNNPSDVPGYEDNNRRFLDLATRAKDCIRRKNKKLKSRWESLANQYALRQLTYNESLGGNGTDMSERGGFFSAGLLMKESHDAASAMDGSSSPTGAGSSVGGCGGSGGGSSGSVRGNNPYRRPRRGISPGDVVRSDYEQEQIIAEIAAKEAMEKRIKEGGCALPRQRGWLEQELCATHTDGFYGRRVEDPMAEEEERRHVNLWSDMEKCIFLDRFLHHPKDFRKIASFLRYKTTKDCVEFYYNSKKSVPYKHALKEFLQRKKRRGDVVSWDATIQSCLAMGAIVRAGASPEKPLKFVLPEHDHTYHTRHFHPMRLEVFAGLKESVSNAKQPDEAKAHHGRRKRSNWFILDASEKRFLKHGESSEGDHGSSKRKHQKEQQQNEHLTSSTVMSKEDSTAMSTPNPTDGEEDNNICKKVQRSKSGAAESTRGDHHGKKQLPGVKPQKWKEKEKKLFLDALDKHGNDWTLISEAVGTRTATQVKNYFFDNKKVIARHKEKIAKAAGKVDKATSSTQAGEPTTTTGKKKKKTKKAKKSAQQHAKSDVSTPTTKTTSESTKDVPSSVEGSTPGGSHPEKQILNSAESIPYVPPVATDGGGGISISSSSNNNNNKDSNEQEEQYRQHQLRLHQQHQDQLRKQLQIQQQQQQHIERLVHQQRQEEMYRQHQQQIQQEEIYRQHLRQQEMLQAAHAQQVQQQQQQQQHHQQQQQQQQQQQHHQQQQQQQQHQQHQQQHQQQPHQQHHHPHSNQQYGEPQQGGQNWNQMDHQQIQNLQSLMTIRGHSHSPHNQNYPMQQQQHHYQQGGGGSVNSSSSGGPSQQQPQHSDLERIYQAAAAAGIPSSALEAALATARGGGGGQQQQSVSGNENHNNPQQQAMSMELLRRLAQQQQQQQQQQHHHHHQQQQQQQQQHPPGDGPYNYHGYGNDHYQR